MEQWADGEISGFNSPNITNIECQRMETLMIISKRLRSDSVCVKMLMHQLVIFSRLWNRLRFPTEISLRSKTKLYQLPISVTVTGVRNQSNANMQMRRKRKLPGILVMSLGRAGTRRNRHEWRAGTGLRMAMGSQEGRD